eukprot:scaffold654_cov207-Ochromonas_danica.AAC.26
MTSNPCPITQTFNLKATFQIQQEFRVLPFEADSRKQGSFLLMLGHHFLRTRSSRADITDNWVSKTSGKHLNEMAISRKYTMVVSNDAFVEDKKNQEKERLNRLGSDKKTVDQGTKDCI